MKFQYAHGIPTVEQAMLQAVGFFTRAGHPSLERALDTAFREVAAEALSEIRMILTGEISTLFDIEGQAVEWNEAVEKCIQVVEGSLA